jgi:hypothetical protein
MYSAEMVRACYKERKWRNYRKNNASKTGRETE